MYNTVVDNWNCGGCANLPLATKIAIGFHIPSILKCAGSPVVIIDHKEEALCKL